MKEHMTNFPDARRKWSLIFSLAFALVGIGCAENDEKDQATQKRITDSLESARHKTTQLELDLQKSAEEIRALREDNRKLTQLLFETTQRQKVSANGDSSAQVTQPSETELREISTRLKAQMETVLEQSAKRLALINEKLNEDFFKNSKNDEEIKALREESYKYQQLLIEAKSKADSVLLKP